MCTQNMYTNDWKRGDISFYPFAWELPILVQWYPLESTCSLLIFGSCGQMSRSNFWFSAQYFFYPFCLRIVKLNWYNSCSLWVNVPYNFQIMWSKVKFKLLVFVQNVICSIIFFTPLLDSYQIWYRGCH